MWRIETFYTHETAPLPCVMKLKMREFLDHLISYLIVYISTRVLLCLKRALRIANAAQQMANAARGSGGSVSLFIEILNK